MSRVTKIKSPEADDNELQPLAAHKVKQLSKVGNTSIPKLDLSLISHGDRVRLHPNSVRMLLSEEVTPQERDKIKGSGGWIKILEPLLTKHVSEALVHDITKICATSNLIPGQFLLRQGLPAKSIFIVISGTFKLISLGFPGIEPLDSSRASTARNSSIARQEVQTFGALIDPPKTSRPSASFSSEVPVYRVASVGPGQLLGEECFSSDRKVQFSVISDSHATVISVPIDSLLPLLTKERHASLSAMCLNTLAHRVHRATAGGSWYNSRRIEIKNLNRPDPHIEMIGTQLQGFSSSSKKDRPQETSNAPAYPISTSAEGQKVVHEQLMLCVVSASANSSRSDHNSNDTSANFSLIDVESKDLPLSLELESLTSRENTANISASPDSKGQNSIRPWTSHRRSADRNSHLKSSYFVHPSQSNAGHSADMLLSRNSIIKNMYEQLEEAQRSKQRRLQPKQGDQRSYKIALTLVGHRANAISKAVLPLPRNPEASESPQKSSVIDSRLKTLLINKQQIPKDETSLSSKVSPSLSANHTTSGRALQSQESTQSRPYNSNFSFLFEEKDASALHQDIISRDNSSIGLLPDPSIAWTSNCQSIASSDPKTSNAKSNLSVIPTPHPPMSQSSEVSTAGVGSKRRKFVVISTADFNPTSEAKIKEHSLPSRPQSFKAHAPHHKVFEAHYASSPRKVPTSVNSPSAAKTQPKNIQAFHHRVNPPSDLFIGSKDVKEKFEQHLNVSIKNSARGKVALSVGFQIDQVGPSLDRDLQRDEVCFSMSPWKSVS